MQNCVMVIAYFGDFANVYQYFETSFSWRGLVIGSTGLTPVFFKAEICFNYEWFASLQGFMRKTCYPYPWVSVYSLTWSYFFNFFSQIQLVLVSMRTPAEFKFSVRVVRFWFPRVTLDPMSLKAWFYLNLIKTKEVKFIAGLKPVLAFWLQIKFLRW